MTVDDENSIYVGGLPYDCTESQLRRVFELFGSILAVKIKNDRDFGGKCYGFVTFTNPRSTLEAINEMDGKTIGGRVVRVNEVKSRGSGGRSMQGRESFRPNQRDTDWDGGRGRVRDRVYDRDRQHDNSHEFDGERERWRDRSRDHDQNRDNFQRRDRGQSREMQIWEHHSSRDHDRELGRDYDLDATTDAQLDRDVDHDRESDKKDHHTKRKHSSSYERQSREQSLEPSDYYRLEDQLDVLIERRDGIYKEKSDMERSLEEKKQLIVDLQKRSMKLEDSLTLAKKKLSSHQLRLTKLYKCSHQVKEYGEKLKSSELELKDLVDSVSMEIYADDLDAREIWDGKV
ncbi:hypothetical protein vseg_000505 [Gypsophila vaccaria]